MSQLAATTFLDQTKHMPVVPMSATNQWTPIHTLPTTQDNAAMTNPETQLTLGRSIRLRRENNIGTTVLFRLRYPASATAVTANLRFAVFGRTGSNAWDRLRTRGGARQVEIVPDVTNDPTDGTNDYTEVDATNHAVDCLGCNEIVVGIEQAIAATGIAGAVLEAKIV